jgi:hypothetical protein
MPAPVEVVEAFSEEPEEVKVDAVRTGDLGPYYEYEGYIITLSELNAVS